MTTDHSYAIPACGLSRCLCFGISLSMRMRLKHLPLWSECVGSPPLLFITGQSCTQRLFSFVFFWLLIFKKPFIILKVYILTSINRNERCVTIDSFDHSLDECSMGFLSKLHLSLPFVLMYCRLRKASFLKTSLVQQKQTILFSRYLSWQDGKIIFPFLCTTVGPT